jgi:hypothetical protein
MRPRDRLAGRDRAETLTTRSVTSPRRSSSRPTAPRKARSARPTRRSPRRLRAWRDADPRSEDSLDERAGSLATMLDFDRPRDGKLFLDPAPGERLNDGDDSTPVS